MLYIIHTLYVTDYILHSISAFLIVFDIISWTFRKRKQTHFKYMRYVMFLGDFLQTFPVNRMIDIWCDTGTQYVYRDSGDDLY